MKSFQHEFIEFALQSQVLRFGDFKLKSGRMSPYFFNAGCFNTGTQLAKLGHFYARAIQEANLEYDVLFGPAYKGIPLVTCAAIALAEKFNIDKPLCFNRKEIKDHGEGGYLVGAPLKGQVLLIDDVITAGTAINESAKIIADAGAKLVSAVIAIDRQERGQTELSAIQEVEKKYKIQIVCIIKFEHLLEFLTQQANMKPYLERMRDYQAQYGIKTV